MMNTIENGLKMRLTKDGRKRTTYGAEFLVILDVHYDEKGLVNSMLVIARGDEYFNGEKTGKTSYHLDQIDFDTVTDIMENYDCARAFLDGFFRSMRNSRDRDND